MSEAIAPIAAMEPVGVESLAVSPTTDLEKASENNLSADVDGPDLIVTFNEPTDSANPKDWSFKRKWIVTSVLSATGFNRIMVSTMMAPALPILAKEFHMNSTETNMSMSVFLLASAFGPLFFGPMSEIYGRLPILHGSSVLFLVSNMVCGFANSKGLLIAARLSAGLGASAVYALGAGVLGDLYRPEQRGRSLGLYMLIPLLAPAIGPIIGGYMTESISWRWMFWTTSIIQAVLMFVSLFAFQETYAPLILERRAKRLRDNTGNHLYYTAVSQVNGERIVGKIVKRSLFRPLRLLAFHPIIQIYSVVSAFGYGVLYIILTTYSSVWTSKYHESPTSSGLHYFSVALGEIVGSQASGFLMDYSYRKFKQRREEGNLPEYRMVTIYPWAILAILGMVLYGWAVHFHLQWAVVDLGIFTLCLGLQAAATPLQAYVIDAYPDHVSSVSAAGQFLKSLAAFTFPLFAPTMYRVLGYGWANSTLASLYLAFYLPAPLLIWFWGAKLRAKAGSTH